MNIPPWLANLTGAVPFATNPVNGFQPTIGDAFQGIGHSMMENYRNGQNKSAVAPSMPAPTPSPLGSPAPLAMSAPRPTVDPITFSPELARILSAIKGVPSMGEVASQIR